MTHFVDVLVDDLGPDSSWHVSGVGDADDGLGVVVVVGRCSHGAVREHVHQHDSIVSAQLRQLRVALHVPVRDGGALPCKHMSQFS